jgi:WD40 repeat protein/nucleoside phosphorylase
MGDKAYLDRDKVAAIIDRLTLSPENHVKAKTLVKMLGDGFKINMGEAGRELWPNASSKSQSTMLNSLVRGINSGAEDEGLVFEIVAEGAMKYGNDNRWLGFVGIPDSAPIALTREYDAVKKAADGNEIIVSNYAPQTSIALLITCNKHERDAVDRVFGPCVGITEGGTQCYIKYPKCGNYNILMRYIDRNVGEKQGQVSAALTAERALRDFENSDFSSQTRVVIGVGIAAGLKECEQKLGDVLIATQSQDLELQRLNPNRKIEYRGDCTKASEKFLQSYSAVTNIKKYPFSTYAGLIVCASKLLDNKSIKNKIIKKYPDAIGYEMESHGLASATSAHSREFFMIKGICDWGEGIATEDSIKDELQITAARNAALLLRDILDPGNVSPSDYLDPIAKYEDLNLVPIAITKDYELRKSNLQPLRTNAFHYEDRVEQIKHLEAPSEEGSDIVSLLEDWACNKDDRDNRIKLLLGEYGMGKTITCQTLYQRLKLKCETGQPAPTPLYFDLRNVTNLKNGVPGLDDVMLECAKRGWINLENKCYDLDDIYGWLDDGALVIFDGLDEVLQRLDAEDGKTFTRGLLSIMNIMQRRRQSKGRGGSNKLLISSRTQFYRTLEEERSYFTDEERGDKRYQDFDALVLLPFDEEQINSYLTKALPDLDIDAIRDILDNTHNLNDLSHRPFALRLISEQIPELEQRRLLGAPVFASTLYKGIVKSWANRDQSKSKIRPEDKLLLVSHLAAHMLKNRLNELSALDLEDWFHEWLGLQPRLARRYDKISVEQLEEELRNSTFLSRRDEDDDKGYYYFSHTSFREYFTSLYMLYALRDNAIDGWSMTIPSDETLEFLHQSIAEEDDTDRLMSILDRWVSVAKGDSSLMILKYSLRSEPLGSTVRTTPSLDGINLDGADFTEFKLVNNNKDPKRHITFRNASFKGAKLIHSQFENVDFTGACFECADLSRSCMIECNLSDSILRSVKLDGASIRYCDINNADADGASVLYSWWVGCIGMALHLASESSVTIVSVSDQNEKQIAPANADLWDYQSISDVSDIDFTPDGSKVVYSSGGLISSMNVAAGRIEFSFPCSFVHSFALSTDGTRLAVIHTESVAIYDAQSGALLTTINDLRPLTVAISADRTRLAVMYENGAAIYDAQSAELLTTIGDVRYAISVAISADGTRLAIGHIDGAAIYDAQSGANLTIIKDVKCTSSVAVTINGTHLAVGHEDGTAIYNTKSGALLITIKDIELASSVAFSADGTLLAVGSNDGIAIYDTKSGALLTTIKDVERVGLVTFSADSTLLAVGHDGGATICDAQSGTILTTIKNEGWVNSVAISADGTHLVVGHTNGVAIYDTKNGVFLTTIKDGRWVTSVAFSANGTRLAVGYDDGTTTIYDAQSTVLLTTIKDVKWASSVTFSADGTLLAVGHDDGAAIYDTHNGVLLTTIKDVNWVNSIAISTDGIHLAVGHDFGAAIYDAQSAALFTPIIDEKYVNSVAISSDGNHLAVGHDDGAAIYEAQSGVLLTTIKDVSSARSVAFSTDDTRLAVGHEDGVTIYDTQMGVAFTTIKDVKCVRSVALSADGTRLAVCDDLGRTTIFDLKTNLPLLTVASSFGNECYVKYSTDGSVEKLGKDAWKCFCWRIPPEKPGESPKLLPLEAFQPGK